jgi:hypothetical protein
MKYFEQMLAIWPLEHLQHMQHPPIYFCNIKTKQLQHTSETFKTLETYICNVGKGKTVAGQFRPSAVVEDGMVGWSGAGGCASMHSREMGG